MKKPPGAATPGGFDAEIASGSQGAGALGSPIRSESDGLHLVEIAIGVVGEELFAERKTEAADGRDLSLQHQPQIAHDKSQAIARLCKKFLILGKPLSGVALLVSTEGR